MIPQWLKNYYGNAIDSFNPVVVSEGNRFAIVRIVAEANKKLGHSQLGYVLLKKSGRHMATPHKSLHEGVAGADELLKMQKALEAAEAT
jgi:hypothetical protein